MDFSRKNVDEISMLQRDEPSQEIGALWGLLRFSIIIFCALILGYAGLEFGYRVFITKQITAVDAEINVLASKISKDQQAKFLSFYYQLVDLQKIVKAHVGATKSLTFLEGQTNVQVYLTEASLTPLEKKITFQGVAPTFEILNEQLAALQAAGGISRVILGDAKVNRNNKIEFSGSIVAKPELFMP